MAKHYNVGDKVQVRKDLLFDMRIKDGKYDRWVGELAEYTGKWVTIKYFDERDDSYLIEEDNKGHWWWDCFFVGHEHDDTIDDIMRTLNDEMKDEIVREVLRKADNVSMEDKPIRGLINSEDNKYICNTVTKTTRKMEIEIRSSVIEVECDV
jgi:ribosomal protein S6